MQLENSTCAWQFYMPVAIAHNLLRAEFIRVTVDGHSCEQETQKVRIDREMLQLQLQLQLQP